MTPFSWRSRGVRPSVAGNLHIKVYPWKLLIHRDGATSHGACALRLLRSWSQATGWLSLSWETMDGCGTFI